jgi:hypothetical protein
VYNSDWWETFIENNEKDKLFKTFMINSTNYINISPLPYFLEFKLVKKNWYKVVLYLKCPSYGNRYVIGDSFWEIFINNDGHILYINKIIVDGKHCIPNLSKHTMKTVFGNKKYIIEKLPCILDDCQSIATIVENFGI